MNTTPELQTASSASFPFTALVGHETLQRALLLDYALPRRSSHAAVLAPERHEFV